MFRAHVYERRGSILHIFNILYQDQQLYYNGISRSSGMRPYISTNLMIHAMKFIKTNLISTDIKANIIICFKGNESEEKLFI